MLRTILSYGAIAGLFVGIVMFGLIASGAHVMGVAGMAIGYTTMLIGLSAIFVAIKRRRDNDLGGVIRFWPALGLGLGISVVAGVLYALGWEATMAMTGMDFGAIYADALVAQAKAAGQSAEQVAALSAEMAKFRVDYANPAWRIPMTFTEIFPVGVLVSLVSAGLLRNSRFLARPRA